MTAPRTEAGRRLLASTHSAKGPCYDSPACDCGQFIASIEAEAIAAYAADLRAKVEGLLGEEWRDCNGNCHNATLDAVLRLLDPERSQP